MRVLVDPGADDTRYGRAHATAANAAGPKKP